MIKNLFFSAGLTLVATVLPASSIASCPSKTIFSCTTTKEKTVEVCESANTIDYSFGKKGMKPEMALSVPKNVASTKQWEGFGRNMYYSVLIPNGNTTYEVFSNVDKFDQEISYGIYVIVNEEIAATIKCKANTVIDNIEGIALKPATE